MRTPYLIPSLLLLVTACGPAADSEAPAEAPEEAATETTAEPEGPQVTVVEPADGSTVPGPDVTVRLAVTGLDIVLAGDTTPGTGHHHLYLDTELAPAGEPIPSVPGSVVHMGDGSSEYTFEDVEPGEHTLIAVVGDGLHVPLQPWVVDTVSFVVREP